MSVHADRREILGAFGFAAVTGLFGDALIAPLARAAEAGGPMGFKPVHRVLTKSQRAVLAAWSERIVPTTDTPGAIQAGVPDYIEMMLGDWSTEDERAWFIKGLDAVDAYAKKAYRKNFARLKANSQDAVISAASAGKADGIPADFFAQSRQMVLTGYYTSEIGMTVERVYLPVPGEYNGAYPYADVKRVFNG